MPPTHEGPPSAVDVVGESGSMSSGPGVRIRLRFEDDVVVEARFETCRFDAARAVAEALCAALVGATFDDAARYSVIDVARLGAVDPTNPAAKLVHYAKSAALRPLLGRRARHGSSVTCTCFNVETHEIIDVIRRRRVKTVEELKRHLPATTGCGTCRPDVQRMIDEAGEEKSPT
jgi:bacterioferritin-associated ferredoxin/NifU-like protein involved in Fe-S cluster formation